MKRVQSHLWIGIAAVGLAVSWLSPRAMALPPDPDNAALLYYQAFLTVAELDKETRVHIGDVAKGTIPPDEKTREYIGKCRGTIKLVEAARDLRVCNWGLRYSQGFEALMPYLGQMRFLAFVMLADARIDAAAGEYKKALDRCLMMEPFARHIGDDTLISYLVGVAVRRLGYECLDDVIGQAAGDAELLTWLQKELATSVEENRFPITALKIEREIALDLLRMENVEKFAETVAPSDENKRKQILDTVTEEIAAKARRLYSEGSTSAMAVLSSSMPYEQAYRQLADLQKGLDPNDPAVVGVNLIMPALAKVLTVKTTLEAQANAIRAAVDICLVRAKTGKLPDKLPAGLPKDPFSGRDFQYERTDTGFVLRCQGKDLDKGTIQEFKFVVK